MPRPELSRAEEASAPRSRKGAETRARLVEAAKEVFQESGFLDARTADIAAQAGVSNGTFYHYFDSKEQIFREVAEAQERVLTTRPEEIGRPQSSREESPYERIRKANRRYLEQYRDEARIMGVIEQVSRYDAHVNAARTETQRHFAMRTERSIERLQKEGLVDEHLDAPIAATALGAMVGRFAELWLVQGYATYDFDEVVDQLTRLWCNALGLALESSKSPGPGRHSRGRER